MFDVLRDRLDVIFSKLKSKGKLTSEDIDAALRDVRKALLEADVDYKVVKSLAEKIRERALGLDVLASITPGQQIVAIVYEEICTLMGKEPAPLLIAPNPPTVILLVGLQGSGKTTNAVKIAKRLTNGHKPLVVACDLKRPAAVEQLRVLAEQSKIHFFGPEKKLERPTTGDVLNVVKNAEKYAAQHLNDVVILDTAGRLHMDNDLMDELVSIKQVLPPTETILVVDAMTGQEAVNVAQTFHEKLSLTGMILTKMDGDARGGSALAIRAITGVPIKFVGMGEGTDALELFDTTRMAQRIMGMGDVAGLLEKVQQAMSEDDIGKLTENLKSNRFTLEDLLTQFEQMEKMGPLGKILEMIPGAGKLKGLENKIDNNAVRHSKAIIQSMTLAERRNPAIIKGSRRKRIAIGSGTTVQKVNQLLAQYEQMKKVYRKLSKTGGRGFNIKNLLGM